MWFLNIFDVSDKLEELIPKEKVAPFFEDMLNRDQFALLVENFLGEKCEDKTLYSFISYIKQYYVEAETDKLDRLTKVRHRCIFLCTVPHEMVTRFSVD